MEKSGPTLSMPFLDTKDDESLCKIVGIDIEKKVKELLDQEKQD